MNKEAVWLKWFPVWGSDLSFHCKSFFTQEHKEVDWGCRLLGERERSALTLHGMRGCEDVSFSIEEWRNHIVLGPVASSDSV